MLVKRTWEIQSSKVDPPYERGLKVVFSPDVDEVGDFTLLVSTVYPRGGKTALHTHEGSGELMYFVTGRGYAILDGESFPVEPDMAFFAPAGREHQVVNTGDETMKIMCVFTPALPTAYIQQARDSARQAGKGR